MVRLALLALIWCTLVPATARAQPAPESRSSSSTEELSRCRHEAEPDRATAETHAYEHYERGTRLYEQGDYEAAIGEFVQAYCHVPSPTVLKDIGQAFERLVNYEKAVAYLQRYIDEAPQSEAVSRRVQAARVQVLRNLRARVRITSEPPGATVTLTGDRSTKAVSQSGDPKPLEVLKGTYSLTIELPGYETVRDTITVEIGQPYSFYYRLQPKKGTLRVVTVPAGARIFVNNRWVAIGNHVEELPIGTYTIRAEADNRQVREQRVEITGDHTSDVVMELEPLPRSGRRELLIAAGAASTLLSGVTAGAVFQHDGAILLSWLFGTGLGVGGAYIGIPERIPVGHSSYIIGSTFIGATEVLLATQLVERMRADCDLSTGDSACANPPINDSLAFGATLAGAAAGMLGSALTAKYFDPDAGDAALLNSGALWGMATGALMWSAFEGSERVMEPLLLTGLNLGVVTGVFLARRYQVSRGHIALIDLSGLLGAAVGTAFASALADNALTEGQQIESTPHFALAGMILGLGAGTYFTRRMDEPTSLGLVRPTLSTGTDARGQPTLGLGLEGRF